jgi:hypothetical protein
MFRKHGLMDVEGYIDADWTGSSSDLQSTSRGGNLVIWRSKKVECYSKVFD